MIGESVLGLLIIALASVLYVLKKRIHPWRQPAVKLMVKDLPGIDCGLCSYPTCEAYAEAKVSGIKGKCHIRKVLQRDK